MTRLRLIQTLFLWAICAYTFAQYDFDVTQIPNALLKKANSVVRHDHTQVIIGKKNVVYLYDYAVTALNKKHADELLFVQNYHKKESKIKGLEIQIFDANGSLIKKVGKKDIKEDNYNTGNFADDSRWLSYHHQSPTFPITMHVRYKYIIESPYFLRTWYPTFSFKQSVESASIRITDELGDSFAYESFDLPEPQIGDRSFFFKVENQKPILKEKWMPNKAQSIPRLVLALKRLKYFDHEGRVESWSDFGRWVYNEMFVPKQDVDLATLKAETAHLFHESDGKLEKAKRLYNFIQTSTRYVFISLKDGGWSPLPISTVHNNKYGDCKALSFYYNTLCLAHGIDAQLALVNAGIKKISARKDFYSTSQFNHVISKLRIDDQTYWVDCTSKSNPFDFLGEFTDDRNVLLIDDSEGKIDHTPEYKNSKSTVTNLQLVDNSNLVGTVELNSTGLSIGSKLQILPTQTDQERTAYNKDAMAKYSNVEIKDYTFQFDTVDLRLEEQYEFICRNGIEKLGDHFKLKVNRDEIKVPKMKKDKNRVWPIQILRKQEYTAHTTIHHDLTMVAILDEDVNLESEFGKYIYTTQAAAGKIEIYRTLTLNKNTYAPERYKELKSFFDKIRKFEKRSIILSSKS